MNRHQLLAVVASIAFVTSLVGGPALAGKTNPGGRSQQVDHDPGDVRAAIEDSRSYLLDGPLYKGDHWQSRPSASPGYGSTQLTMRYALTLQHLGVKPESKRAAISYLLGEREADGGWNDPVIDHGMLLLLRKAGPDRYANVIEDVRAEIEAENYSLSRDRSLQNQSERMFNPRVRLKLYYASLSDRHELDELFPNASYRRVVELLFATSAFQDGGDLNASTVAFPVTDTTLAVGLWATAMSVDRPSDNATVTQLSTALLGRRVYSGAWQTTLDGVLGAMALYEAGYAAEGSEIQNILDVLEERQLQSGRLTFTVLPVWETAWVMRALNDSGVPASHDAMQASAGWLMEARMTDPAVVPSGSELARPPAQFRETGFFGWGYRPDIFADWDDTAAVITALRPFGPNLADDALRNLFAVQSGDGSWTTYYGEYEPLSSDEARRIERRLGEEQFHVLFGTRVGPAVNGHVLEAAGHYGYSVRDNESVRDAVEFLFDHRAPNEMWAGVWGERYTYATSRVLLGMRAVGVDMDRPAVQRAARALAERQNPDGGWGERSPSRVITGTQYPDYATAASTVEQTAWAIQALLAAGYAPRDPAVQRGVDFLLDAQRRDGSWESSRVFYFTGAEPLYNISAATQATALRALEMYADERGISADYETGRQLPVGRVPAASGITTLLVLAAVVTYVRRIDRNRGWDAR